MPGKMPSHTAGAKMRIVERTPESTASVTTPYGVSAPRTAVGLLDEAPLGRFGGELYGDARLAKLTNYLERRGVQVVRSAPPKRPNAAGALDAFAPKPTLYLPENVTKATVWHELWHCRQMKSLGVPGYRSLPRPVGPEQFAFDKMYWSRHWNLLNPAEQGHYMDVVERAGGEVGRYGLRSGN